MNIIYYNKKYIKVTLIIIFMIISNIGYPQSDCSTELKSYKSKIDSSIKPEYLVDSIPEFLYPKNQMKFFKNKFHTIKNGESWPLYIYYGFVIKLDGTISNVFVCPHLIFCDDKIILEKERKKYIEILTSELLKIKTNPSVLNGENVAVYKVGRIHFDPQ